jgi:hypothetical protein
MTPNRASRPIAIVDAVAEAVERVPSTWSLWGNTPESLRRELDLVHLASSKSIEQLHGLELWEKGDATTSRRKGEGGCTFSRLCATILSVECSGSDLSGPAGAVRKPGTSGLRPLVFSFVALLPPPFN